MSRTAAKSVSVALYEGRPPEAVLERFVALNQSLFGFGETAEQLGWLMEEERQVLLLLASVDGRLVGYKMGFRCEPGTFESWRGGVEPEARRQGVARALMERQHDWCAGAGFRFVQTAVSADNVGMLILNLRSGFRITGSYVNRAGVLKLSLEKRLSS
jgi:GNAT superfamily N-acetyltransferase